MDGEALSLAQSIGNCALRLGVEVELPPGAEPVPKLRAARMCNRRLCPFCEARRVKAWRRRFFTGLPKFHEDFPTHKPLFLTLTQRNCAVGDLRETIKHMNKAWHRMNRCAFFPTPFWFRSAEVTVGEDGSMHPHFHVLLLVPSGYFSHGYVRQSEWRAQWQMAGRYDYPPVVDVRRCRAKSSERLEDQTKEATLEASKYATKATDLLALGPDLGEYNRQVKGLRFKSVSYSLKPYISAGDISEEEMLDGGNSLPVESVHGIATWFEDIKEYLFTDLA